MKISYILFPLFLLPHVLFSSDWDFYEENILPALKQGDIKGAFYVAYERKKNASESHGIKSFEYAEAVANIAHLHQDCSDDKTALRKYLSVLNILKENGQEYPLAIKVYLKLASIYVFRRDFGDAQKVYHEALNLCWMNDDTRRALEVMHKQARCYAFDLDFDAAERIYNEAMSYVNDETAESTVQMLHEGVSQLEWMKKKMSEYESNHQK